MAHAIRVHKYGGPEAMSYEAVDVGAPGAGQVKLKQHAIGVNFIDVYQRTGLYPQPSMPFTPGNEGAGEVTAVGEGVTDLKVGDRVAYAGAIGAYADERLAPADKLVKLPDAIPYETGAAMMLQGMTVQYLLRRTYKVGPETTLLMHAAAGGIGLIACQWAKHLGATIIGTASSDEKCALAKAAGATHMINYKTENFVERVNQITGGKKCDVVYDSIGKDTFPASLDCLKPLGLFVTFGNASGPIDAFNAGILAAKGSLYMTRPTLNTYTATRADLVATAKDLFDVVASGAVKINVNHKFALKDAAQAHKDLEGRKTTGSIILLP
ncbi:MAG: quinone oxidoreductase [Alphaproteobacteria bacterium 64-6]|uniref:quinone oxidoreductase family protein n=1 Tax=Hyphomicrobium sp. CS1BSMeth3 TaxID=1892844 RepID=UPI000931003D|nr:quinone oxidoreductase [Hyphomicrobium sp. CS1BSMeth3]MBN9259809.1 quinone oxidoreductase [Hyphomicrobium sp.]MBN9264503.1 quinone oxidoreductase [Hyphomicrobium sp.]OJU26817.1 MAG: quinone oxidoreductase [Alphaproteobacteria bacterium 64-6]